jgi:amidase
MQDEKYGRRDLLKAAGAGALLSAAGAVSKTGDGLVSSAAAAPAKSDEICYQTATDLVRLIRTRKLSAREVMAAHLERIALANPKLNAIVAKLDDKACLALADAADKRTLSGEPLPPLHGLPTAFKDLQPAVGFPWTRGSPIYKDAMPTADSLFVERLRKAGVLPIGKTNTPEFGMGSHTFNKVYGTTLNPYDTTKTAGGSSGGAAVSLATGMLPIADGSDHGGSLRNPGNFNNIVGFRPSVGFTPNYPTSFPWLGFSVAGPLARNVQDVALLMSVMSGPDARDAGLLPIDPKQFVRPLGRDFRGVRVAWSPDLGGLPMEPRVRAVLESQRKTFEDMGCIVENAAPDLRDAEHIFITLRSFRSAANYGPLLKEHRDLLKKDAIEEIEYGQSLSSAEVATAMMQHAQLLDRMRQHDEKYAFTLCAVNQLAPFDAKLDWPHEVAGVPMEHYIAWQKTCYWISATWRPAMSVPAGFTPEGLPVGIQIVGSWRDDFGVLQLGHAFEQATKIGERRPKLG